MSIHPAIPSLLLLLAACSGKSSDTATAAVEADADTDADADADGGLVASLHSSTLLSVGTVECTLDNGATNACHQLVFTTPNSSQRASPQSMRTLASPT